MSPERIRIDPAEVIHETLDGEVILIALQTGCYYSLADAGADVWSGLAAGRSTADVAAALEERYEAEPGAIPAAVQELVSRLVDERLVLPDDGAEAAPPANGDGNGGPPAARQPFRPPVLHKFTDMQDFLLVDPIHDVEDTGWPNVRPAG